VRIHQLKAVGGWRSIYSRLAVAPGAGAGLAPVAVPVPLTGVGFTPAGLGDVGRFGLNKRGNLNLNLLGVGDATGVGLGVTSAVFLRTRFGVGEAAGDSAAEGDAALSAGEAVAAAFLDTRCSGGEGDSVGGVPVSSCD
jgi:hypothetical protein